ncbi:hypothetical protein HMPREF3156_02244, partial [Neisseria sp. HMSC06F02]
CPDLNLIHYSFIFLRTVKRRIAVWLGRSSENSFQTTFLRKAD